MCSQVPPLAGPSPAAGPAAEEAKSADLRLIYSGPLLRSTEVTRAVRGDAPAPKPHPLPAVETPTMQTHQAPSLSASVLSSCPVRRGGRAEGTQGGSCSPSLGLRNQSNKSQGERLRSQLLVSTAPRTSAHLSRLDAEHQHAPSSSRHLHGHTHAHTRAPPATLAPRSRNRKLRCAPGKAELQPAPLALCPQRDSGFGTATPLLCCALCVTHPLLLLHRPHITAFREQLRRLPPPQARTALVLTGFFCLWLEPVIIQ